MRKVFLAGWVVAVALMFSAVPVKNAKAAPPSCDTENATEDLCKAFPSGICCMVYEGRPYCFPMEWINYFE